MNKRIKKKITNKLMKDRVDNHQRPNIPKEYSDRRRNRALIYFIQYSNRLPMNRMFGKARM